MFYLTKRISTEQCTSGERCMTLVDSPAHLAGHKGTVRAVHDDYITVAWDARTSEEARSITKGWLLPLLGTFSNDTLDRLVFETAKHPDINPEVIIKTI